MVTSPRIIRLGRRRTPAVRNTIAAFSRMPPATLTEWPPTPSWPAPLKPRTRLNPRDRRAGGPRLRGRQLLAGELPDRQRPGPAVVGVLPGGVVLHQLER